MIRVSVDTTGLDRMLLDMHRRQIPFATATAINETAKQFQIFQRRHMHGTFKVRRANWVDQSVKITHFAKKQPGRQYAEIAIVSPGGGQRSDILAKFEEGGMKRPRGRSIAVPDSVKRTKADVVSKANRPKAFHFKLHGKGSKATVYRGDKRTFMIQRPDGSGAIYQRFGSKIKRTLLGGIAGRTRRSRDTATRTLYSLTPDALIDRRLKFVVNARGVVRDVWAREFNKAFGNAVATSHGPATMAPVRAR
jgi:hypothetical protein